MNLKEIRNLHEVAIDLQKYARDNDHHIKVEPYVTVSQFTDLDAYEAYLETIIDKIKTYLSESKKVLRKMYVAYKFDEDDEIRTMSYIKFIFNLIMWRPYLTFKIPLTEEDIFNAEIFHNKKYNDYFDKFSDKYRDNFTMAEFSETLFWTQVYMNKVVTTIGPLFGHSISIFDMLEMAKRNKEVDAIINTEIDLENFKVSEVEEFLTSQTERLMEILLSEDDANNPLKPFIRAGIGVNKNQVKESYVNLGFKPDLQGNTIPIATNSNLMTNGLTTPEAVFVDSKGARKAAILQLGVSTAGYLGRHNTFATSDITLNEDSNYSCDTVNLFKTIPSSIRELEALEGRFRKVGEGKYKIVTKNDTKLIGTEIELRSPTTCANKENKICKCCYGTLYNVNYGTHAGLFAAIDSNEAGTQIRLSARHALTY